MEKQKLIDDIENIVADIDQIKSQLNYARSNATAYGEYSDPDWYNRARAALKVKGRQHQSMLMKLGQINKQEKRDNANRFEALFVDEARKILHEDDFQRIWYMARLRSKD